LGDLAHGGQQPGLRADVVGSRVGTWKGKAATARVPSVNARKPTPADDVEGELAVL